MVLTLSSLFPDAICVYHLKIDTEFSLEVLEAYVKLFVIFLKLLTSLC